MLTHKYITAEKELIPERGRRMIKCEVGRKRGSRERANWIKRTEMSETKQLIIEDFHLGFL